MFGDRKEKEHQFSANQPNAGVTFETGAKCPAQLSIACDSDFRVSFCMSGRQGSRDCPLSCWGSDWFIRYDGKGEVKVTRKRDTAI